jgi:hypothetical protein
LFSFFLSEKFGQETTKLKGVCNSRDVFIYYGLMRRRAYSLRRSV